MDLESRRLRGAGQFQGGAEGPQTGQTLGIDELIPLFLLKYVKLVPDSLFKGFLF